MRIFLIISIFVCIILIVGSYGKTPIPGPDMVVGNPLTSGSAHALSFNILLGGILVFVFYWAKFGQWPGPTEAPLGYRPKPTRHFTTWLRYSGWAGIYSSFMVLVFAICIYMPSFITNSLQVMLSFNLPQISSSKTTIETLFSLFSQNKPGTLFLFISLFDFY